MPEIELEKVSKSFNDGNIIAVNEVNLKLRDRDYIFILGPSGCGKTTLLKMISGLLTPTDGLIYINSSDVTKEPPQTRGIAFIFQNFEITSSYNFFGFSSVNSTLSDFFRTQIFFYFFLTFLCIFGR